MGLLNSFRNKLFWTVDFLKGGQIWKHYKEIKLISENYHSNTSRQLRERNLSDLLNHAVTTTPFYKGIKDASSIESFPVIDKGIIRNNFEEFKSITYREQEQIQVSSSGSTGIPFKVYQNRNKRNRNIADTIYHVEKSGYKLGTKLFYLRVWTAQNRKSPLLAWLQNIEMQDITNLNDKEVEKLIKALSSKEEKGIISYASSLEVICKYLDKVNSKPLNCNLNAIIANSERLNEYTRAALKKYFNTPVVSRYSNAENGILSQQNISGEEGFDINWASYFVEILKFDEDKAVEPGEYGRVVITDLFNWCMPIIRYDTGDIACLKNNNENIPSFKKVEGRKLDLVYNTKGELLSSYVIGSLMAKYSDLNQYQFIQEGKIDYVFKLNTATEFTKEPELIKEFRTCLGPESNLKIKYVDEIPLLASGKRRQVVNNYVKT